MMQSQKNNRSTVYVRLRGKVQGVSFRDSMREEAQRLGVAGWVRNLEDGSVEAEVQGSQEDVEELLRWTKSGPPPARVEDLSTQWKSEPEEELSTFEVRG